MASGGDLHERSGAKTLLSTMVARVAAAYAVGPDVSEDECRRFLGMTRSFFLALSQIDNDPVFVILHGLTGVQTEKTAAMRVCVVASLLRPYADRVRAHDESVIVSDRDGLLVNLTPYAVAAIRPFWGRLNAENKERIWEWLDLILDRVSDITVPVY